MVARKLPLRLRFGTSCLFCGPRSLSSRTHRLLTSIQSRSGRKRSRFYAPTLLRVDDDAETWSWGCVVPNATQLGLLGVFVLWRGVFFVASRFMNLSVRSVPVDSASLQPFTKRSCVRRFVALSETVPSPPLLPIAGVPG